MAVAALVLGILSIVLFCIPFVGVACGVAALVLGILGMKRSAEKRNVHRRYCFGICRHRDLHIAADSWYGAAKYHSLAGILAGN